MASTTLTSYQLYPLRWLIQIVCCLVAFTVPLQWLSYVPVAQELRTFYCKNATDIDCDPAFITNQIFQFIGLITGIAGMYVTDQHGIRLSIWMAVSTNLFGALLRVISSIPAIEGSTARISLLYTGTVIVSISQSFFLVLPAKIAQFWFPEDQRATANVAAFIMVSLGEVVGVLIPSLFFDSTKADEFEQNSNKFFIFNSMMCGLCFIPFVLAFFINKSSPPTPPSGANSALKLATGFWKGILECFKNGQFYCQLFIYGMYFALLWGVMVILPDLLRVNGYNLSGFPIVAAASAGAIFALTAARIADRTKKFAEIMKFSGIMFFFAAIALRLYFLRDPTTISPFDYVVILFVCALLGGFSTIQMPIGMEIGVETTFPVQEATSSGLLVLSLQLWMFNFYFLFDYIKNIGALYEFDANSPEGNYKLVLDVWVFLSFIMAVFTFIFLRPKYNRIAYEKEVRDKAPNITTERTSVQSRKTPEVQSKQKITEKRENNSKMETTQKSIVDTTKENNNFIAIERF